MTIVKCKKIKYMTINKCGAKRTKHNSKCLYILIYVDVNICFNTTVLEKRKPLEASMQSNMLRRHCSPWRGLIFRFRLLQLLGVARTSLSKGPGLVGPRPLLIRHTPSDRASFSCKPPQKYTCHVLEMVNLSTHTCHTYCVD